MCADCEEEMFFFEVGDSFELVVDFFVDGDVDDGDVEEEEAAMTAGGEEGEEEAEFFSVIKITQVILFMQPYVFSQSQ